MLSHHLFVLILLATFLPLESLASTKSAPSSPRAIHYPLRRRSQPFTPNIFGSANADLAYLTSELSRTESRFNLTKREVKGNRLVRRPKASSDGELMGDVALEGAWFVQMGIGSPSQIVEVDLNMLGSDFWVRTTTGKGGTRFDDFFSGSNVKNDKHPFPSCTLPMDNFHLPTINQSVPLTFAYCRPRKASQSTLGPSGSMFGLAPSKHLSQTGATSILEQLVEKGVIEQPVFSLTLIGKAEGVLSLGGTIAPQVDKILEQTRSDLDAAGGKVGVQITGQTHDELEDGLGQNILEAEDFKITNHQSTAEGELVKRGNEVDAGVRDWTKEWAWAKTQGAEGWWQILMSSVWVDGTKVMKNQAVVIDLNTPFILAPPLAAKEFYASVSGAFQLPPPHSHFYAFPCLNPPHIDLEFGGSKFAFMRSARGQFGDWKGELPGGRFSMGRLRNGSGYCIGNVVATRMGLTEVRGDFIESGKMGKNLGGEKGGLGGNGMRDVWVIGEGFFRGMGVTFDLREKRVGFRRY